MNRSDFTGRTIGNWQLLRLLGEGAFGSVYEAQHQAIAGRKAAVKVLDPQMSVRADIKRRFVNEASAASRAAHENIVQVFDGGVTSEGECYVVMELLSGHSLAKILQSGRLNVGRAVNVGVQAASALQAAHNLGIIHRDLKPDNIYIVARDHNPEFLKVLDFGIAKLRDDEGQTKAGMWVGTPGYMSPEQWQTLPDIDGRSDIYALGIILYECMTGRLPYAGTTPYDWLTAHLNHPVPDPSVLAPMPPILSMLIQRMMAKRREDRPQSMTEVIAELQRCAVLKTNPWVRMMAEEPSGSLRRSGTIELPSNLAMAAQSSTMRQGTGELQGMMSLGPRMRVLPYVLVGLGSVAMCFGGLAGAYYLDLLPVTLGRPDADAGASQKAASQAAPEAAAPMAPAPAPTARGTGSPTPTPIPESVAPAALMESEEELAAQLKSPVAPSSAASGRKPSPDVLPEEMASLGPGRFSMGSGRKNHADGPAHTVEVKRFAIGKYEVTISEYQAYAVAAKLPPPVLWEEASRSRDWKSLPMTLLTRQQAESYCNWRYSLWGGRLPTEAEWEFAARDGRTDRRYPWPGKSFSPDKVNAGQSALHLLPVNSMPDGTTDLGLLNMIGNAAEWTASDGKRYPGGTGVIPSWAVVRGGAADTPIKDLTAMTRIFMPAEGRYPSVGFRCAVSAK